MLNLSDEFGQRVAQRLANETLIWLVTVGNDGMPQPSLVWFWWDGSDFLIYSQPGTPKIRNIQAHPKVALNLNSDAYGGSVAVFTGTARLEPGMPSPHEMAGYLEKYRSGMQRLGMRPEQFGNTYSLPILVTPTTLRGH